MRTVVACLVSALFGAALVYFVENRPVYAFKAPAQDSDLSIAYDYLTLCYKQLESEQNLSGVLLEHINDPELSSYVRQSPQQKADFHSR